MFQNVIKFLMLSKKLNTFGDLNVVVNNEVLPQQLLLTLLLKSSLKRLLQSMSEELFGEAKQLRNILELGHGGKIINATSQAG